MIVGMKFVTTPWRRRTLAITLCAISAPLFAADKITEISINQPKDLFPESITSLKDGTIILGSVPGGARHLMVSQERHAEGHLALPKD